LGYRYFIVVINAIGGTGVGQGEIAKGEVADGCVARANRSKCAGGCRPRFAGRNTEQQSPTKG
jgi:hypothetical protein